MKILQKDLIKISQKTNGHCFYCGSKNATEVDHFFPNKLHKDWNLEKYINNDNLDNLFLSCRKCNRKKSCIHPEDFIGNNWIAWSRFYRANYRVGLSEIKRYSL